MKRRELVLGVTAGVSLPASVERGRDALLGKGSAPDGSGSTRTREHAGETLHGAL
jgi:hypothetical protein